MTHMETFPGLRRDAEVRGGTNMGSGTFYCSVCGTRLSGSDFESGRAVRLDHLIRCADCVRKSAASKPESKKKFPAVPAAD
jgi:hypothetical protein